MASEVLITISKNEVERARLLSEMKYELDMQSKLAYIEQKEQEFEQKEQEFEQKEQEFEQKEQEFEQKEQAMEQAKQEALKKGLHEGKQEILDLLKSGKSPEEIIRDYET